MPAPARGVSCQFCFSGVDPPYSISVARPAAFLAGGQQTKQGWGAGDRTCSDDDFLLFLLRELLWSLLRLPVWEEERCLRHATRSELRAGGVQQVRLAASARNHASELATAPTSLLSLYIVGGDTGMLPGFRGDYYNPPEAQRHCPRRDQGRGQALPSLAGLYGARGTTVYVCGILLSWYSPRSTPHSNRGL